MPTGVPRQDIGLQKDFKDREEKLGSTKENIEHENGEEFSPSEAQGQSSGLEDCFGLIQ